VVSIGRFKGFVLSCGRDDQLLACLDQDPGRVLQATQEGWDETRKTSRRDPLPRPWATKMSVGAATARCWSWAVGCHFRLGIGGVERRCRCRCKRRRSQVERDTASLPLHTSLQSPGPAGQAGSSAQFPFSHFQGLRSVHFWRRAVDPACSKSFVFHQLKLPDVRLSTRQAVFLRSTIALSGSIGSTSPASWRSRASKPWMRKARSQRSRGEVDPL
jgi:hypothetical protein